MRRGLIALTAFALLAAACGQYPGVHEQVYGEGVPAFGPAGATTQTGTGEGASAGTTTGTGSTTGGTGGTTTGGGQSGGGTGGTGTGGTGGSDTGGGGGGGGAARPRIGNDATGVTADTITIGLHAPLTGAAPLKQTSFDSGKELYWQRGNNGKPVEIFGRQVRVVFRDDRYNPSYARSVCQEMAEQENAFLLIGGGGTDQTQACAQYAASKGIPYVSAGVTELGLTQLPNYFALSMSYPAQIPLLAQMIRSGKYGFKPPRQNRLAAVITNTSNFDDAAQAFERQFPQARIFRPEKADPATAMASQLCDQNGNEVYDVVFPLTSPNYYYQMATSASCRPQYVGVGITMGLNSVANLGCQSNRATEGALFFSPAPAFIDAGRYDRAFTQAGGEDDIVWLLWGLSKTLHQMFDNAGPNLTREGFMYYTSRASFSSRVFPDLRYSENDHFGANQVHLLENVCEGTQSGYYDTAADFRSSF